MDKIIKEQYIVSLIVKETAGTISESESSELRIWLSGNQENQEIYESLKQIKISDELQRYRHLDVQKGWKKYEALHGNKGRHRIIQWISAVAAVVVFVVGIWGVMRPGQLSGEFTEVVPGSSKAILVLSDGTLRNLVTPEIEEILQFGALTMKNNGTSISYKVRQEADHKDETSFNELRIPTGGEYQLVLSDGTHVWLNSETKLRYPVCFTGEKREVYLEGEAYFEVAKDKEHPFCVATPKEVIVEVLGTSFNVRAYQDENQIETVLEEGCVKMAAAGQSVMLEPGHKSCYHVNTRNIDMEIVNTKWYTEWRSGQFIFVKKRVEDILRDIARWYGINVFYQNEEVKDIIFSGSLKRYESIMPLLKAMEMAGGVTFEIKKKTLTVHPARNY